MNNLERERNCLTWSSSSTPRRKLTISSCSCQKSTFRQKEMESCGICQSTVILAIVSSLRDLLNTTQFT